MIAVEVTVLPDPDSPTIAVVIPSYTLKDTPDITVFSNATLNWST